MTTGAHDDLSKVTQVARAMITQWGMSERLGARTFGKKESMVFLGRDISEQRDYSETVAEQIDEELRELIDRARDRARTILRRNRDQLDLLAGRLMKSRRWKASSCAASWPGSPATPSRPSRRRRPTPRLPPSPISPPAAKRPNANPSCRPNPASPGAAAPTSTRPTNERRRLRLTFTIRALG